MSIFELQGLQTLSLSSNNFNGSLQLNVIQPLRNLFDLDLSNNNLLIEYNGINSSLSSFPQIITLDLASNKLKTFPEFLRNQAEHLDLSDNQIHGEIPNWLWKLPRLDYVNLSCNYLEGPLHNLLSIDLLVLDLHSNQLQGQLPIPLPFFVYMDLSRNNFNSNAPMLDLSGNGDYFSTFLSLSSNKFHGQIPESICNATSLEILDLSNNSINRTIPQYFSSISNNLMVLDL